MNIGYLPWNFATRWPPTRKGQGTYTFSQCHMQWIKLESRLRLRRKHTFTRTVQSCIVMDNYRRTKLFRSEYGLCPRNCVYNDPRCSNTVLRKISGTHARHRTPTRRARRGGVGNKKHCANAVVHSSLLRGDRCFMCSAMDSSSAVEGHAFGQEQPPLYVTIQKILDKYPDGQIFKVCRGNVRRTTL